MSFYMTHKRNIKRILPLTKAMISPGQIILFRYQGKKDGSVKDKLAVVLNVFPPSGPPAKRKVHAISLNQLSLPAFRIFLNTVGTPRLVYDKTKKIFNILLEGGRSGRAFYYSIAKKFNKENAYRTYTLENLTSPKLIEYDFEKVGMTFKTIKEVQEAVQFDDEKDIRQKVSQVMVDNPGITKDMAEQLVAEQEGLTE